MSGDLREGRAFPRDLILSVALAWLAVAVITLAGNAGTIAARHFADPDDTLRLIQVRDLLGGQGWFDLHQYRVDPPSGVLMHWSRLVDAPLALFIIVLRPLLGTGGAELATCVLVPLLTLAAAQLLAGRIAHRVLGREYVFIVSLLWAVMLPTLSQLKPLRIDHHGWQIVAVLAAINGLLSRDIRKGGCIVGASLAFGMSISLELLPFTALFAGVFALRWLGEHESRKGLVAMLQSLSVVSIVLLLATHGLGDLANHCDTVSPAYILGFMLAAGAVTAVAALPRLPLPALCVAFGVTAVVSSAVFLAAAPACTRGPFAALDPLVRTFWYDNVLEGMPVWRQPLAVGFEMLGPPLIGLAAVAQLFARERDWKRRFWLDYGLLLAGSLAIAIMLARFAGVACAIATVPVGWQLRQWLNRAQAAPSPAVKVLALAAMLVAVMPGVLVAGAQSALGAANRAGSADSSSAVTPAACGKPESLEALNRLPPGTLFAPLDFGPDILVRTRHKVVATSHHRGAAAMHDIIAGFIASPDKARAFVLRHNADFVVSCANLTEAENYQNAAHDGLMARLNAAKAPSWLEPVALPSEAGTLRVWKVVG